MCRFSRPASRQPSVPCCRRKNEATGAVGRPDAWKPCRKGGEGMSTGLGLIAVLALVLLNGFFVAAEFALVSVRRSRIEQLVDEGSARARQVRRALSHLDTYIAATQLGITMASLALGFIGEPALAHLFEPLFRRVLPHGPDAALTAD